MAPAGILQSMTATAAKRKEPSFRAALGREPGITPQHHEAIAVARAAERCAREEPVHAAG